MKKQNKAKIVSIILLIVISIDLYGITMQTPQFGTENTSTTTTTQEIKTDSNDPKSSSINDTSTNSTYYPSDYDIGKVLSDRENEYTEIYEPWKTKGSIHAIDYDEETGFLAVGGGYLYDNEVHIYRLNTETGDFDKVWDSGDGIIQSDVLCLDIADTDSNQFLEIIAGSADGHVYVFEQRHIYDPITNTENMFDHVWTSPSHFRVFDLKVDDIDRDNRPDIVVGSWDGIFVYEYDNHSGYPFSAEHWIEYRNVWTSGDLDGEQIYSLETGDTNVNGLPEIVIGTRSGKVYVYENDGITMMINGQPFPLTQDNEYYLNWTSGNNSWKPIISMDIGELDGDIGEELVLISQGQGVYILEWNTNTNTYDYNRVFREFESWETFGYWGLDYWADRVVSANNVSFLNPVSPFQTVDEPITSFAGNVDCYPYNTGMAGPSDNNITCFYATGGVDNATAIIDFGKDEEGTGGANADADIIIHFDGAVSTDIFTKCNISISQDGTDFEQISSDQFIRDNDNLGIDVDIVTGSRQWEWFRFVKISVFDVGEFDIDSLKLVQVYNPITDALSVEIGSLKLDGDDYIDHIAELDKIIVGTITGKYLAVSWNDGLGKYELSWDSENDYGYSMGTGIWDIQAIPTTNDLPIWRDISQYGNETFGNYPLENWSPTSGLDYNSWSYGLPNYFMDLSFSYLLGSKTASIHAFNFWGQNDTDVNWQFEPINDYLESQNRPYVSVEMTSPWTNVMIQSVFVGSYNPTSTIDGYGHDLNVASIDIFTRTEISGQFTEQSNIEDYDLTGEITALVSMATNTPKMDFADIDGDNDQEMIFSTGKLYLGKNLYSETDPHELKFTLVPGYFDEVNDLAPDKGWGQPEFWDLDRDGDHDLIISYEDGNKSTAFINRGTTYAPEWEEDSKIMALSRMDYGTNDMHKNLKDPRIIPNNVDNILKWCSDLYDYGIEDYSLVAMNGYLINRTTWFEPLYDTADTYLVATYPELKRMEFSLMDGTDFKNFGYQCRESWSNKDNLDDWSLTIKSADLDGDGNNEFIVGDYDNNVYAFEHMKNNNYKRMYETHDLNHSEITDQSPYLHGELEGIDGNFTKTIWDHAKHLLADVDLDQDGKKEMVIASNLQVYIFEDKGLYGGDELEFAYTFDIRDSIFLNQVGWDQVSEITAITQSTDLDGNNQSELVVAAGPYLFVYNVPANNFNGMEDNEIFVTSPDVNGRYNLIGNPLADDSYQYAIIQTLTTGDTDQDGYEEIIIGGINDSRAMRKDGFTFVYESHLGTFMKVWQTPVNHTFWNTINLIKIDDQDYDGNEEIIIAHENGIDIWEWIPNTDSEYYLAEYITSSPNYPNVPLTNTSLSYKGLIESYNDRWKCSIAQGKGPSENYIMEVVGQPGNSNGPRIWYRILDKTTGVWSAHQRVTTNGYEPSGTLDEESEPDVMCDINGTFYVVWRARTRLTIGNYLYVSEYHSPNWATPIILRSSAENYHSPCMEYYNSEFLILSYVDEANERILFATYNKDSHSPGGGSPDLNYKDYTNYDVQSISFVLTPEDDYTFVFSAQYNSITKDDYDIYTFTIPREEIVTIHPDQAPIRATSDTINEIYPDITYIISEEGGTLLVTYERFGELFENKIGLMASNDYGNSWEPEKTLNLVFQDLKRIEDLDHNSITWEINNEVIEAPFALSPSITAFPDGGFQYTYLFTSRASNFYTDAGSKSSSAILSVYGSNDQSDWTRNSLHDVVDFDVGDTDGDGRKEIVVGFDHQVIIYELNSSLNTDGMMSYKEDWVSKIFTNEFTGITISDFNGNGWEEMGISTKRGDVYLYEFMDPSEGATPLTSAGIQWSEDHNDMGTILTMVKYDIDSDGIDEIIGGGGIGGRIYCIDKDGQTIWYNSVAKNYGGSITRIELHDISNDGYPEMIASIINGTAATLMAVNISNGNTLWQYAISTASTSITCFDVEDANNDGNANVIIGLSNSSVLLFDHTGVFILQHDFSDSITVIKFGHFTGVENIQVALGNTDGQIIVFYPLNGTEIYIYPGILTATIPDIIPYDFDNDGISEIVFGYEEIRILDVVKERIIYNSTTYGPIYHDIFVKDFDGDGKIEILTLTKDNGVYLEDITTGQIQWHYKPDIGQLLDMEIGNLGGSGLYDVAVVSNGGVVVALDGRNGIPMWFSHIGDKVIKGVIVGALATSSEESIVAWDSTDGELIAFSRNSTGLNRTLPTFEHHQSFGNYTPSYSIVNFWTVDIDSSGRDEIIIETTKPELICIDQSGVELWDIYLSSSVKQILFGNLTGDSIVDVVILKQSTKAPFAIDGYSGSMISGFSPMTGYSPIMIEVADLSNTNPYDEIICVYDEIAGDGSKVGWYKLDGTQIDLKNYGEPTTDIAIGDFTGDGCDDIAVASLDCWYRVYNGLTGVEESFHNLGHAVIEVITADLDTDSDYDDLGCIVNNSGTYEVYQLIRPDKTDGTYKQILLGEYTQKIEDFQAIPYIINPAVPHNLLLKLELNDTFVFNSSGDVIVRYSPSRDLIENVQGMILCDDIDNDGSAEFVFTNLNYINVMSWNGVDTELDVEWHHNALMPATQVKSINCRVGYSDIVYSTGNSLIFLSTTHQLPDPIFGKTVEINTNIPNSIFLPSIVGILGLIVLMTATVKLRKKIKSSKVKKQPNQVKIQPKK
jgi:hypothetical protein